MNENLKELDISYGRNLSFNAPCIIHVPSDWQINISNSRSRSKEEFLALTYSPLVALACQNEPQHDYRHNSKWVVGQKHTDAQ